MAMTKIKAAATEFLSHKRVAVTGVSREPGSHGGNVVYRRLRDRGYEVFAVNPNADEVEGDRRLPVHVRPNGRSRSQGDALHPDALGQRAQGGLTPIAAPPTSQRARGPERVARG
jgi:CoA binding domain